MTSPLIDRTLSIPELFETVLLHLPLRDLLHAQRICHLWKETINQSPTLRKKLFFQPISDRGHQPEFNPLLKSIFPALFDVAEHGSMYDGHEQSDLHGLDWYEDERRRKRVLHPNASWRRMFPVQPPARIEHVTLRGGCYCIGELRTDGVIKDDFQIFQENGATMGLLWDVTVHLMDLVPESTFFVRWHMFPELDAEGKEKDVERQIVEDGDGEFRVVLENRISVWIGHSFSCFPDRPIPCKLQVVDFDPRIIEYDNGGLEEQCWKLLNLEISD